MNELGIPQTTVDDQGNSTTVITQINPDPNVHIAGAFQVPVFSPVESNWNGILVGGLVLLIAAYLLKEHH